MDIPRPYLLFLGDAKDDLAVKTATGILDWRRDWCVGQVRLPGCNVDLGLPDVTAADFAQTEAKTLVIGVVNPGGVFPDSWIDSIVAAANAGLNIANGLHTRLASVTAIADAALANDIRLFDVRQPTEQFKTGSGKKRPGLRLLTVGTDCSIGKKYTALALERDMRARGFKADFRATGQTGILISGHGVPIDAVVSDFIAGAAEWISPAGDPDHWDIIEGQGSLFHPSFAGVTLGLLHGSQPDAFVVCHEPTRTKMRNVETPMPTITQVIEQTIAHGRLTNPAIQCVGIAVNTAKLSEAEAQVVLAETESLYALPAVDPVRQGTDRLIDNIEVQFK